MYHQKFRPIPAAFVGQVPWWQPSSRQNDPTSSLPSIPAGIRRQQYAHANVPSVQQFPGLYNTGSICFAVSFSLHTYQI